MPLWRRIVKQERVESGGPGLFGQLLVAAPLELILVGGGQLEACLAKSSVSGHRVAILNDGFGIFLLPELRESGVAMALYPLSAFRAMNRAVALLPGMAREFGIAAAGIRRSLSSSSSKSCPATQSGTTSSQM